MRIKTAISSCIILGAANLLMAPAFSQQAVVGGGVVANGRVLAMTWCSACHLVPGGRQATVVDVPTFQSLAQRLPTDTDVLSAFIANPHPPMPNLNLGRQDIRDILAYIASLR